MPRPQKSAVSVRPEADSSTGHFLHGNGYFVAVADFSDETIITINAGRALPALFAVLRALHDQYRRGRPDNRADAAGGRLTIGLKALSRANGMQPATLRHQLEFLQRAGLLKMHEGERVIERDPVTGKIIKGRGRTPPKVIVMTLNRSMMRGGRRAAETGRSATQRPEETGCSATLSTPALRVAKRPPSIEHPTEGVPMEHSEGRGREHPAHGGRSAPPPQKKTEPASGRPAEEPLSAKDQTLKGTQRFFAGLYAKELGITYEQVVTQWKRDGKAFLTGLEKHGIDWRTGRKIPLTAMLDGPAESCEERKASPPPPPAVARLEALEEGERYIPSTASTFAVRRQTTASLTVCPSVAGEAAQALDRPPVSEDELKAGILNALAAYQGQAGLTAGEAMAGAGAGAA